MILGHQGNPSNDARPRLPRQTGNNNLKVYRAASRQSVATPAPTREQSYCSLLRTRTGLAATFQWRIRHSHIFNSNDNNHCVSKKRITTSVSREEYFLSIASRVWFASHTALKRKAAGFSSPKV